MKSKTALGLIKSKLVHRQLHLYFLLNVRLINNTAINHYYHTSAVEMLLERLFVFCLFYKYDGTVALNSTYD